MAEITDTEMKGALSRSGYLLEARVEDLLLNRGYQLDANIGYPDPLEGKTRELDARAMKGSILEDRHSVWATLLIECSNNLQPLVLMTKAQSDPLVHEAVPCCGLPLTISGESVQSRLSLQDFHHYCKGTVATQFCSFQQKKDTKEWMACHDEGQWSSIKKLGDALVHDARQLKATWVPGESDDEPINLTFYYCALVLQGRLVHVDARAAEPDPRVAALGVLRRAVSWHRKSQDYFIDFVTEAALPAYLDLVDQELGDLARRVGAALGDFKRAASEVAKQRRLSQLKRSSFQSVR